MKKVSVLALGMFVCTAASAKVTFPKFITDNMVLQQNSTMTLPGHATPGAKVTVKTDWLGDELTAKAGSDGSFRIAVPTPAAGGPFTMIVSDGDKEGPAVLSNLLSGEVWLCSGQSNMEFTVAGNNWGAYLMDRDEVVATAQHPDIRLLRMKKTTNFKPQEDGEVEYGGWVEASPATMNVSAIGYLFALQMQKELGVPVGIMEASWGGTPAEAWTAYDALKGVPGFEGELATMEMAGFEGEKMAAAHQENMKNWFSALDKGGRSFDVARMQSGDGWGKMPLPEQWEKTVLPDFDGVVWIQRELDLPASAAGQALELSVGIVDDLDDTYFNGTRVGGYEDPRGQRTYTVPGNLVKAGKNVITVRIVDFMGDGGIMPGSVMQAKVADATYPLNGEWSYLADTPAYKLPQRPSAPSGPNYPTVLYNAMLHPLKVLPFKGVLWYQGCANVGRDAQYETLFKTLIKNWRETFDNPDMPFYFVQLAGFQAPKNVQPDSQWALLRNSQAKALELPNTGMAVAIDLGNPVDIPPANKQEVARRLGLIALNRDYGHKDLVYEAPVLVSAKADGNRMVLKFNGTVKPTSTALTGFIIGDKDGNFAYANARLEGNDTVVLTSPLVTKPTVARYDWADYPGGNLYGTTGLPVAPFATDK